MNPDIYAVFWAGSALFSAVAVLLSNQLLKGAFYLFFFFVAVAGLFGSLGHSIALIAQLILYVGGIMVLMGFVLFLHSNQEESNARFNWVKVLLLTLSVITLLFTLPINKLFTLFENIQEPDNRQATSAFAQVGYRFAADFGAEFEILGFLLLAALGLSGLYLKEKQV